MIFRKYFIVFIVSIFSLVSVSAQKQSALTLQDVMQFKQIRDAQISDDGSWVAHTALPDRGDPEVRVYATSGKKSYTLHLADKPLVSCEGNWVAARKNAPALEIENAAKDKKPKPGLILLNTRTGEQHLYDSIQSYRFSNDGSWLFLHAHSSLDKKTAKRFKDHHPGSMLKVISLKNLRTETFSFVTGFAADSLSGHIVFAVSDTTGAGNAVYVSPLSANGLSAQKVLSDSALWADHFAWSSQNGSLAFLAGIAGEDGRRDLASLYQLHAGSAVANAVLTDDDLADGWRIYHENQLRWTYDGERLFIGTKPVTEFVPPKEEEDSITDLYDTEQILAEREVDVWHWDDPLINPNQKKGWSREKDRTYTGVFTPERGTFIQLADKEMRGLQLNRSADKLLGYDDLKYAKRRTWDGWYRDYYIVDVLSGDRRLVLEEQQQSMRLSPDGMFMVYYRGGDWYLYDVTADEHRNLTVSLEVPFENEDWDYPQDVPGYGVAGWMEGSSSVLIYDKYDIWQFETSDGTAVCLTEGVGREEKLIFRLRDLKEERHWFEAEEEVLVYGYHDLEKYRAVYAMEAGKPGVDLLLEGDCKYSLISQADASDEVLFTRMTYNDFPDLQVAKPDFRKPVQLSSLGGQTKGFAWGEPELVEWLSVDGRKIQGILIKPGNYQPGKKYPVLVYYYRFFTDRLHNFPDMAVNHRPNFPYYASNGYAIFLPDIRFDVGTPGYAATKSLVPGVQKIIDMGVADPDAIALHGHSWSGYQTAFMITQTDLFACAIAGAPVSNMTSAYSGIRWGTGLARQFQYEKTQSRIGGSLWEARDKYIENSPVFFADRINTPLLIQFGDEDGAVPWYQGIELYLAMRRLEKDCVFLQYRGEDHHLKKYANKLDYTVKFKEYLDHYLKGEPAAEWIREGVEYRGE